MSGAIARYRLSHVPEGPAVMRAQTVVWRQERSVVVVDRAGARSLPIDWDLYRHELTQDGRYLLVLGDEARRAEVLEVRSGRRVLEILGDDIRRHSLRVGLGPIGDEMFAFVASRMRPNALSLVSLADGTRRGWLSTAGMIGFEVDRVLPLDVGWLGFHGHGDGEQYDTVLAAPAPTMLEDVEVLQTALREPRVKTWGYRVAIGPVAGGHTVTFRDPEWGDDDPPDDPDEAFCGLRIHDPTSGKVIERLSYTGAAPNGAVVGGDAVHIAIETGSGIDVVERGSGQIRSLTALALDPHRLEVARLDGLAITIDSVADLARSAG